MSRREFGRWLRKMANRLDPPSRANAASIYADPNTYTSTGAYNVTFKHGRGAS